VTLKSRLATKKSRLGSDLGATCAHWVVPSCYFNERNNEPSACQLDYIYKLGNE